MPNNRNRLLDHVLAVFHLAIALCPMPLLAASAEPKPSANPAECTAPSGAKWPEGTEIFGFENLDGLILVAAKLHGSGGRDTAGLLALDTGAGYLALDHRITHHLGIVDSLLAPSALDLIERPLPRLEIASIAIDQVSPVLSLDLRMPRQVTDRPVLGLLGRRPIGSRVLYLDYRAECGAFVASPARASMFRLSDPTATLLTSRSLYAKFFSRRAAAVPFRLAGDGKILVEARIGGIGRTGPGRWLTWIVDTGATKCVLFEDQLGSAGKAAQEWPSVRGLRRPHCWDRRARASRSCLRSRCVRLPSAAGRRTSTSRFSRASCRGCSRERSARRCTA